MIDGTIDPDTYHQRKRDMALEIAQLRDDRTKLEKNDQSTENVEKFFELMKSLARLHRSAKRDEKRQIVENCFSNRTLNEKKLDLEPNNWLQKVKNLSVVTDGDPQLHTSRTFMTDDVVHEQLRDLMTTFDRHLKNGASGAESA